MVGLPTSLTASTAMADQVRPWLLRQMKMADDVLDHHNGVVHQDADGEDQREERDAVQRVAVEVKHQQRQRERGGNGDGDDERFAPAQRQQDQQRHAEHGDAHVPEQFVGFLLRRQAVIPRDGHLHVGGNDAAFERVNFPQDFVGDRDGVGARPLGDGQGDGGLLQRTLPPSWLAMRSDLLRATSAVARRPFRKTHIATVLPRRPRWSATSRR